MTKYLRDQELIIEGMLKMLPKDTKEKIYLNLKNELGHHEENKPIKNKRQISYSDGVYAIENHDTVDVYEAAAFLRLSHQSMKRYNRIFDYAGCIILRQRGGKTIYDPLGLKLFREWIFTNRLSLKYISENIEDDQSLRNEVSSLYSRKYI